MNDHDLKIHLKGDASLPDFPDTPSGLPHPYNESERHGETTLQTVLLRGGEYFGLFYRDGTRFAVQCQGREVWADWTNNSTLEDACTYLLGPVLGFVLRLRGMTPLHASVVARNGSAIAFVGHAGAGKSTTAAALAFCGFSVLSDDVAAIADCGVHPLVQPGYARVNLWPDSVQAVLGSEFALPRITANWHKRFLPLGQNGTAFESQPLPLRAIYVLGPREQSSVGPRIEEISQRDAFICLIANTYVNYLLNHDMRSQEFDLISRMVARIPVRLVYPAVEISGLLRLCEMIAADSETILKIDQFVARSM